MRFLFKCGNCQTEKKRDELIAEMVAMLQHDAPWLWGYFPKQFSLKQTWISPTKASPIGVGSMRYLNIDAASRAQKQKQWNVPIIWPVFLIVFGIVLSAFPVSLAYYKRAHQAPKKYKDV